MFWTRWMVKIRNFDWNQLYLSKVNITVQYAERSVFHLFSVCVSFFHCVLVNFFHFSRGNFPSCWEESWLHFSERYWDSCSHSAWLGNLVDVPAIEGSDRWLWCSRTRCPQTPLLRGQWPQCTGLFPGHCTHSLAVCFFHFLAVLISLWRERFLS